MPISKMKTKMTSYSAPRFWACLSCTLFFSLGNSPAFAALAQELQSDSKQVPPYYSDLISVSGGSYENSAKSIDWVIGETIIETICSAHTVLTQGLLQPSVKKESSTDTERLIGGKQVKIYPNPFSSEVNIQLTLNTEDAYHLQFVSLEGKLIKEEQIKDGQTVLHTESLLSGMYILNIYSPKGNLLHSSKVFKK